MFLELQRDRFDVAEGLSGHNIVGTKYGYAIESMYGWVSDQSAGSVT
jgi:hypothetical protein